MKQEATFLELQLALLRSALQQHQPTSETAQQAEVAMGECRRRRVSERENTALRRALFAQRMFLLNAKTLLASSGTGELNLHRLLHSYCHLGTSVRMRAQAVKAMFSDAKLDLAAQIVLAETAPLRRSVLAPSFAVSRITSASASTFGGTVKGLAVLDSTTDVQSAALLTFQAALESQMEWPQHTLLDAEMTDDPPKQNPRFKAASRVFQHVNSETAVMVEARSVSCVRVTEQYSLLVIDSVDVDEMRASKPSSACVKQDIVAVYVAAHVVCRRCGGRRCSSLWRVLCGRFMVRREVCDDGVERVVARALCTKVHSSEASLADVDDSADRFMQQSVAGVEHCAAIMHRMVERALDTSGPNFSGDLDV